MIQAEAGSSGSRTTLPTAHYPPQGFKPTSPPASLSKSGFPSSGQPAPGANGKGQANKKEHYSTVKKEDEGNASEDSVTEDEGEGDEDLLLNPIKEFEKLIQKDGDNTVAGRFDLFFDPISLHSSISILSNSVGRSSRKHLEAC